jgi:hypothetical protein
LVFVLQAFIESDEEEDGGDDTVRLTVSRVGTKLQFVKQQRASRWDQHNSLVAGGGAAGGSGGGGGSPPAELAQLQRCTEALECLVDPAALKQVRKTAHLFLSFPYICPEPVLAK